MRVLNEQQITQLWVLMDTWIDYKGISHRVPYYEVPKLKVNDRLKARTAKINKIKNGI